MAVVAGVLALWLCCPALAQPPYAAPLPSTPGSYVLVPHGRGYVYVPLDLSGMPAPAPPVPPVPPTPPVPGTSTPPRYWFNQQPAAPRPGAALPLPAGPGAARVGYLQTEIEPAGADVFVDGRRVGPSEAPGAARTLFALDAGLRKIEIARPGFKPLRTEIRVTPQTMFAIKGRLEPK